MINDAASLMSEGDKDAADVIEAMQAQQETQRALSDELVRLKVTKLRRPNYGRQN